MLLSLEHMKNLEKNAEKKRNNAKEALRNKDKERAKMNLRFAKMYTQQANEAGNKLTMIEDQLMAIRNAQNTRDTDILTEYVRQSLRRAISNKYFYPGETTSVITLDPKIEQEIMQSVKQTETGAYLTLDPSRTKAILRSVGEQAKKLEDAGMIPIIMTSPIVRMYFKKMTEDYYKDLIVLSYNEVEPNVEMQSVGMVAA